MVIQRKRKKVHGLHLPLGKWCTNEDRLRAVQYFRSLFGSREEVIVDTLSSLPAVLSNEKCNVLCKPLSEQKVYHALMSMKSYKAPDPDDFQPIFFKKFWNEVEDDLWHLVQHAFAFGYFDPCFPETLIVLIPKGNNPSSFKDFRPIGLCNVIYKLISKAAVARLRPMFNDLVSPNQSSFIHRRGMVDNVVVLQEVVYATNRSRKKKGIWCSN